MTTSWVKKKRFCVFNYVTAAAAVSSAIRIQKEFLYNDAFFGYLTNYIIIGTYLPTLVSRQTYNITISARGTKVCILVCRVVQTTGTCNNITL